MDLQQLFQALFELYVMMLLGFVMAKTGMMDAHMGRKLSNIVVTVTYPMLLLRSMQGQEKDLGSALTLFGAGSLAYLALILCAELLVVLLRVPQGRRQEFKCLLIFGNTGFIGAPLAQALYGDAAFFQMNLVNFAYYIFYYTYAARTLADPENRPKLLSKKGLLDPGCLMTFLALALYFLRLELPGPVVRLCESVGEMTTPLAMIILGASLAACPIRRSLSDGWTYVYSIVKLLVLPGLFCLVLERMGAARLLKDLLVLSAAMPAGSMVLMLVLQTRRDSAFISRSIVVSTLLSGFTLPAVAALFLT